jgi:regulator of protease activity HflC (stomatin/prohibitin superfamily)
MILEGFIAAIATFVGCFIFMPIVIALSKWALLLVTVGEKECRVYMLFGKVTAILDEPGLHSLWTYLGLQAVMVQLFGECHTVDLRLDQEYLRSQPVNSEEGAPMGIGIWYEMYISDPIAFLFKNADPRGSLRANVSNSTVRSLSNMKLGAMLESRHEMSQTVREEVSPKSNEWGYRLGSVYIRKVHFRDVGMIRQIEEKVVNRLRQVTSAIQQDGANQVNLITSAAQREAAIEFAKAAAMRPYIVGLALQKISEDREVASAMFEILENQKMLEGDVEVTLIPQGAATSGMMTQLLATQSSDFKNPPPRPE